MKYLIPFLPVACLSMVSCELGGPYNSGGFDPLDPAGGGGASVPVVNSGFRPGEFVRAVSGSTAFFKNKPSGDATADRLLPANTMMKVISDDGSFVKVELDSGELGYVPSVMVMGKDAQATDYSGAEYQVYPPVEGVVPLAPETPADSDVPVVPPTIDPDAPADLPPLPDDAPTPGLGAEPALPEPESSGDAEPSDEE